MFGLISSIVGGLVSGFGAKKAASQQAGGYDQAGAMLQPYAQAGADQINPLIRMIRGDRALNTPFKFDASQLESTPGYKFALNQGLKASAAGMSAKGLGLSGAMMRGASQYATGLADQTLQNAFNRQFQSWQGNVEQGQRRVSNLMELVGQGRQAAAGRGDAAIGGGASRAGGTVGMANAATGAIGDISAPYYMKNYQNITGGGIY